MGVLPFQLTEGVSHLFQRVGAGDRHLQLPPKGAGAKPWQWAAAPKDGCHALRHTYASIMWEAGESVVTLARWLGHSSPTITLDHYAHFMPEAGNRGRGAIDTLLGGMEGSSRNSPDSPRVIGAGRQVGGPRWSGEIPKVRGAYSLGKC